MKKNFMQGFVMSFALLFAVSCQKDSKSLDETVTQSSASKPETAGSCRLTSYDYYNGLADFHNVDYFSYKNGLVDYVIAYYGAKYVMEYDKQEKLIASKIYVGETLLYIISFVYENNRVVKETWRDATTGEVADDLFLTYDHRGNLVRNESFILQYYVTYTHDQNGSLRSWHYFSEGLFLAGAEYTYEANFKNPFKSLTGIDYAFWFVNSGFSIGTGQRWYSTEKSILPDENGDPFIYYENEPAQTVWQAGRQHFPIQVDYFDINTQLPITTSFQYENCEPGQTSNTARFNKTFGSKNSKGINRIKPPLKLLQTKQ